MVKVSVVLPTYNVGKYIEKCIESLLSQSLKDIEFIFIDDKGTDNSVQIIEKYTKQDSRIKILHNEKNRGVSYSRNRGIETAKGEFIHFLDPDDWLDEDFYEKLYRRAIEENADICCGNYCINRNGKEKKEDISNKIKEAIEKEKFIGIVYTWGFGLSLYRTEFLKTNKIVFPQLTNGEDIVFLIQALCCAKKFTYDNTTRYHYILHENSASTKYSRAMLEHIVLHYRMLIDILQKYHISQTDYVEYVVHNIFLPVKNYWHNVIDSKGGKEDLRFFYAKIVELFAHIKYQKDCKKYLHSEYYNNLKNKNIKNLVENIVSPKSTKKIYLLHIIPIYKITKKDKTNRHYLFGFIPLFKIKEK